MSDNLSSCISNRDVASFIEPQAPLITNPFMRRRPVKGTNLMDLYEEESVEDICEDVLQVYLRVKPCTITNNLYEVRDDKQLITSLDTNNAGQVRKAKQHVSKMFTFSHIFSEDANQREIFDLVVKDNLKRLKDGRSFTLLTYGASGSGKTYTLMGTVGSPGLVPRSLEYLFKIVEAQSRPIYKPVEGGCDTLSYSSQEYELQFVKKLRKLSAPIRDKYKRMSCQLATAISDTELDLSKSKYFIWVSFIEIYNEAIYDLLAICDTKSKLVIREDTNGNVYIKGATQAFVRSGQEAYDVMIAGKHNLQVAATGVHANSSRSHCIFTITLLTEVDGNFMTSCVRLCDLAGSERAQRTRNTGTRMKESRAINTSLHVFERCLHSLRRKQTHANCSFVPYRESKLTRLLGAGLSGNRGEAVKMVVTINPSPEFAHETKHVLQLAAVAKDIQINSTVSDYPSSLDSSQDLNSSVAMELMQLRENNSRLHFELEHLQTRYKEIQVLLEKAQMSATHSTEVVQLVNESNRQYYEPQIDALQREVKEIREEYEDALNDLKQNQLTELASFKEKLAAEKLARARAESEIEHLRACIEERDGNVEISKNDNISLAESDSEMEDVSYDESLEPTFTKDDINRSILVRKSILGDKPKDFFKNLDDTLKDSDTSDCSNSDNVMTCKKNKNYSEKKPNTYYFFDESLDVNNSWNQSQSKEHIDSAMDQFQCDINDETPGFLVESTRTINESESCEKNNDSLAQFEQLELEARTCKPANSLPDIEFGANLPNTKPFFYGDEKKSEMIKGEHDDSTIKNKNSNFNGCNLIKNIMKKKLIDVHGDISKDKRDEDKNETAHKEVIDCDVEMSSLSNKLEMSSISIDLFDNSMPLAVDEQEVPEQKVTNPKDIKLQEDNNFLNIPMSNKNKNKALVSLSPRNVEEAQTVTNYDKNKREIIVEIENTIEIKTTPERFEVLSENIDEKDNVLENDNRIEGTMEVSSFQSSNVFKEPLTFKVKDEKPEELAVNIAKETESNVTVENTIDAFDDIYKNITLPRPTEFDLLLSDAEDNRSNTLETKTKYNLRKTTRKTRSQLIKEENYVAESNKNQQEINLEEETLSESKDKCELKPIRNVRLRRRKEQMADLQTEFCDVTVDHPATSKVMDDISTPKKEDKENMSPILRIQSCPSKSVIRSRRKLFTPRVEALEEACPQTVDCSEQIRVPRPSYHRPRARRKL